MKIKTIFILKNIEIIKNAITKIKENNRENNKKKQFNENINCMLNIIFCEKPTAESIKLYEVFTKKFESELAKKGLDAQEESANIDEFFKKKILI